ncbi:MAG: carbon-nitrogen hydrolase family protein [Synergistaceae bacterium]|nr:carbon-nitrogen hydrolase family protein [Synergistaceae bacterium]
MDFRVSLVQTGRDGLAGFGKIADTIVDTTELILMPEFWTASPDPAVSRAALELVSDFCGSSGSFAVTGGMPWDADGRLYVRTWMVDDAGRPFAHYDKTHIPSRDEGNGVYSPGDGARIFDVGGIACAAFSGYDLLFPEFCRMASLAGAMIFFVSADWPREYASLWEKSVSYTALVNQCFVIACNGTGNSIAVSPEGTTAGRMSGDDGVLSLSLNMSRIYECRKKLPLERDRRGEIYALFR